MCVCGGAGAVVETRSGKQQSGRRAGGEEGAFLDDPHNVLPPPPPILSLSYAAESGVVGGVSVNRQEQCSGTTRSERRAKRKKKVKEQRDPKRDLHSSTAVG